MRIGVFGGSFNPVHYGHLLLAETCRESCRLDEVRLTPAAVPPHKQGQTLAPGGQRLEMLQLAIGGHPALTAWDAEIQRGGVSYTADTLLALRDERPQDELFLLMGADSLRDLPSWRRPDLICELACLIVVERPGSAAADLDSLAGLAPPPRLELFRRHVVRMPLIELSSSDVRRRVGAGKSIRFRTPRAVEKYIETAGLYK